MAQKPAGVVKRNATFPVIDGIIDEIWATANTYNMDKIYRTESLQLEVQVKQPGKPCTMTMGFFLILLKSLAIASIGYR